MVSVQYRKPSVVQRDSILWQADEIGTRFCESLAMTQKPPSCHCEERGDVAISRFSTAPPCPSSSPQSNGEGLGPPGPKPDPIQLCRKVECPLLQLMAPVARLRLPCMLALRTRCRLAAGQERKQADWEETNRYDYLPNMKAATGCHSVALWTR